MPHQCTNCGRTFPDGSKEMLSGCPDCGGNKFQFEPAGSTADDEPADTESSTDDAADAPPDASTGESVTINPEPAESASADRQTSPPETEGYEGDAETGSEGPAASGESPAQSTARSDVVDSSEFTAAGAMGPSTESPTETAGTGEQPPDEPSTAEQPAAAGDTPTEAPAAEQSDPAADQSASTDQSTPDEEQSNLHQLRKELNDQFESIRIVSPGQYELNLMELYDREEYIISLREDGRYVIEVPDSWDD